MDAPKDLDLSSDPITWVEPLYNHCHSFIEHCRRNIDIVLPKCTDCTCLNLNLHNL